MIIPKITNRNVRLLALPLGTDTGIAWAIGETIGLTSGLTRASLRSVRDLRGIGVNAGVRAGIALMRPPQCAKQHEVELK